MKTMQAKKFVNETVVIDECQYQNCIFDRCVVVYRGGAFNLPGCTFLNTEFVFEGHALRTLNLMAWTYSSPNGKALVEEMFQAVRDAGTSPQQSRRN